MLVVGETGLALMVVTFVVLIVFLIASIWRWVKSLVID